MAVTSQNKDGSLQAEELEFLNFDQIKMIDEALSSIKKYGEVRLVLDNNRLRFIVCQVSFDAHGFTPGQIRNHGTNSSETSR